MDSEDPKEKQNPYNYFLYGMIVHLGKGAKSGHYYSYVRTNQDEWFKCNDSMISKVSFDQVLKEQAYILFY